MSTESLSIALCLSCIAANRLVLNLRGLYYTKDFGDTTIFTTCSKPFHDYALRRFREFDPTSTVASSNREAVDVAVEEENHNRRKQAV